MNRIDRLTAILIHLQSKKIVKAAEIADRFSMSLRTVYRDIKALQEAGVPIGAEAGTGYYIVEGYHLPPVMFNEQEAAALLTGEKMMEQFGDQSIRQQFASAMKKIRAVLRSTDKDFLENLEAQIAILRSSDPVQDDFPNRFVTPLQQALARQQVISLEYSTVMDGHQSKRVVEPIGLFYSHSRWHLIAWCRLRQDYRDFRADRIKALTITNEIFKREKRISLQDYLDLQKNRPDDMQHLVIMHVRKDVANQMQTFKREYGLLTEAPLENGFEMTFLVSCLDYFARWILTCGDGVKVISPVELITTVRNQVQALQDHHGI
ncbi:Predicted DNA-binding transcriptional regulator YafY, contains an HTH and WYL domains [Chitinophaga costaii]|uniref:Predicted DNA-binding transcriptional regulator YafY, contains an HTH and WYL domains n=1 Tax=Chitinophaga costaii TaxID=1335309 RepID=A0A1C4DSV6_9BACT|nr:YafY family protein [Chitinophaga costaii]PUZ27776.1 YafY family transcriptional regulator [Chitinophaga costaii]SCC34476.1 Predicted DNA-binding transcriptional regulator YafY, contains an HTH and WYL domains [Chitinophaga costaii]